MFELFADLIVYQGLGLDPAAQLGAAAHFFVMDVVKILVLLTAVIYLLGLLRALLTPERVREFMLKRSSLGSRFAAVGLGAVTPFCSCSSVPLFIGFVEAGIPLGVTLSFLIASPMINQVAVGVPLYSDAVGMIPIAEVLLAKGIPVGTVLAFMMTVTALSLPEMLILRKVVRWPLLGVFAGYLAISFVFVGVFFNSLRGVL